MIVAGPISGYSTQAQLSLDVAEIINNGRIRFWFATEFNPIQNEPTSRPLCIFKELDVAAKTHNLNEKASGLADNLRAWVNRWEADGLIDRGIQAVALQTIKAALEDVGFAPRLFYLAEIVGAVREAQPDEYRVENYPIVSSKIRQIIPQRLPGSAAV